MTWGMYTTSLASVMALVSSTGACIAAYLLWRRSRSTSCEKLSARLTAAESMIEALCSDVKAIRQARAMAASREKKRAETDDPEAKRAAALRALQPRIGGFPHA